MNSWIRTYYQRFRAAGYTAQQSLRSAKIEDRWTDEEREENVRMVCEPDDYQDLSYYDQTDCYTPRQRKEALERIDREGVWVVSSEFKCPCCESWISADAVAGIEGPLDEDFHGYGAGLKKEALDRLDKAKPTCTGKGSH